MHYLDNKVFEFTNKFTLIVSKQWIKYSARQEYATQYGLVTRIRIIGYYNIYLSLQQK